MSNNNMDSTTESIFRLGMEAGRKELADHIVHQFECGKPAEINGQLYFLKDARQNLFDIMDDLETAWNEETQGADLMQTIKVTGSLDKG